jgi:hypothetical protein
MVFLGLKEDAQLLFKLAPSLDCVQKYSELAKRFTIASQTTMLKCSRLVQEQHLLNRVRQTFFISF